MSLDLFRAMTHSPLGLRHHLIFHWRGRWAEASPLSGWNDESVESMIPWIKKIKSAETLLDSEPPFPSLQLPLWFLKQDYKPLPIQSSDLFLGGIPRQDHAPCIKLKTATHFSLFPSHCRFRLDCQGKALDQIVIDPIRDRIDYIEDCPHPLPFPMASDRLGAHSIIIHKPTVRGLTLPLCTRLILSSSFESDLGLCQIAAFAHAKQLEKEIHGLGTLHLMKGSLLKIPPTLAFGIFTPPADLQPQNLSYLWTIPSFSK